MRFGLLLGIGLASGAAIAACGPHRQIFEMPDTGTDETPDAAVGIPDAMLSEGGGDIRFPDPIIDGNAPQDAADQFSKGSGNGAAPCVVSPEPDTLYPQNWLRPRFEWDAPGYDVFELRVHSDKVKNDLLVYTTKPQWTMTLQIWNDIRLALGDSELSVTVRAGKLSGQTIGNFSQPYSTKVSIAPVEAPGSIVYWSTAQDNGQSGILKGFKIGEEGVADVLHRSQIQQTTVSGCMGCHEGTPDGLFTAVANGGGGYSVAIASVEAKKAGTTPSFLQPGGKTALASGPLGISTTSAAHWKNGDHVIVASTGSNLVWIDLEAQTTNGAKGTFARTGSTPAGGSVCAPTFSHDGNTIAYVSTNQYSDGRCGSSFVQNGAGALADIHTIPFGGRNGGTTTPVQGASDPNYVEYYPAFSPDDALLAFVRAPNNVQMYHQALGEVFVVPSKGGTAHRLVANDPPACTKRKSPGVVNSWPKWAPGVVEKNGKKYYWIVFSSVRRGDPMTAPPQLFIASLVEENGQLKSSGSLHLWNQPAVEGNHTPSWADFKIPPANPN